MGKRLGVDIDTQALLQFVGSSECLLPWLFVLACIGKLIALSAKKTATRKVQLGHSLSTISSISWSRADEIGAITAEPTRQMNNADYLGYVLPFPTSHSHGERSNLNRSVTDDALVEVGRGDQILPTTA
jgi:hypothetical protein